MSFSTYYKCALEWPCHCLLLQGWTARMPGYNEHAEHVLSAPIIACSLHGLGGKNSVSLSSSFTYTHNGWWRNTTTEETGSATPCVCRFVCMFVCLCVCSFVCLSVRLSVCRRRRRRTRCRLLRSNKFLPGCAPAPHVIP